MATTAKPQQTGLMTRGKFAGINALADAQGVIAAAAMDQRGSLRNALIQAGLPDPTPAQMTEFKAIVTEGLTPYASAILLDPEYSLPVIPKRAPDTGVLLAYEKWGYETSTPGRLPDLLPDWSVRRLAEAGATAIKILLYYDPDDKEEINRIKLAFIERVGGECRGADVPFFLEPIAYSDAIPDEKGRDFAKVKPEKVRKSIETFSQPRYGVDILKVEVPVNLRYVAGTRAGEGQDPVYDRDEALGYFRQAAAASRLPFIYLSAAVNTTVFHEALELATEAGVPYSGVLCGRATWQNGIPVYVRDGATAFRRWVETQGVENIQALNALLAQGAWPWWDAYGGKARIQLVDSPPGAVAY
jgi:tagatose 1,6-diphosphate aldolase